MPQFSKTENPAPDEIATAVATAVGVQLRLARKESGMSQSQVARALGYAPSLISSFESGARRLKVDDLVKLCALFDKSADYFIASSASNQGEPRVGVKLRAQLAEVPQLSLKEAIGAFLDYAELELARTAELPHSQTPTPEPELAARQALKLGGITEAPVDVDRITRALGIPVILWSFPDSLSALLADTESGGFVIGVNRWHAANRQRFSVAHECGHAFLRHKADFYLEFTDVDPFGDEHKHSIKPRHERDANKFAAALLMDARWLKKDHQAGLRDAATLAAKYRVSEEAMSFRLRNLGLG